MTSSLIKHALVVVGILFFVTLFLIPAAHYRAPSTHGRYGSSSGLVTVFHSIRSFIRSRCSFAFLSVSALLISLGSLSRLFVSVDSSLSEPCSGSGVSSAILRC